MTGINCRCPICKQQIRLEDDTCSHCGARLYAICPFCGRRTFIQSNCKHCRSSLYVVCPQDDCRQTQLIQPDGICRFCGKLMKPG